jgi:hypothetical protein
MVGDPRRWEPGLGSTKRRNRQPLVTDSERVGEYLKHRVHALALQRWINRGMPDEHLDKPLNQKQRRQVTRKERLKAHDHRYEMGRHNVTGKSATRRRARRWSN